MDKKKEGKRVMVNVEPIIYDILKEQKRTMSDFIRTAILYYLKHEYTKDHKRLAPKKSNDRIGSIIEYLMQNDLFQKYVTIRKGNNYYIREDFKKIHNLYGYDLVEFEERFLDALQCKPDNEG